MSKVRPAWWVSSVYFSEGLPAVIATDISLIIFADLGIPKAWNLFFTNLIGFLPLLLVKTLWAPVIDCLGTKRQWIITMQLAMAAALVLAALCCRTSGGAAEKLVFAGLMGAFMLAAFFSASYDVAADGFYILALSDHQQAFYTGWRSTFYRVSAIVGTGGLLLLAGWLKPFFNGGFGAWQIVLAVPALLIATLAFWHWLALPYPDRDVSAEVRSFGGEFKAVFRTFFAREHLKTALAFLLLFRLGESQLLGAVKLFFLDEHQGMGLSIAEYGFWNGTCGTAALLIGGIFAGITVARFGFGRLLMIMVLALNLPDLLYLLLAFFPQTHIALAASAIVVEQFGYGFGFAGYMLFMVWYAGLDRKFSSSHFALMTVFMLTGLRVPAMLSGAIFAGCEILSGHSGFSAYQLMFAWACLCTIPGIICVGSILKIVPVNFGVSERR